MLASPLLAGGSITYILQKSLCLMYSGSTAALQLKSHTLQKDPKPQIAMKFGLVLGLEIHPDTPIRWR